MFGMASVFEARGENAMGFHTSQQKKTEKGKETIGQG